MANSFSAGSWASPPKESFSSGGVVDIGAVPSSIDQCGVTHPSSTTSIDSVSGLRRELDDIRGLVSTSSAGFIDLVAGEALSGHRAVAISPAGFAVYASSDTAGAAPIGVTTGAAASGAPITVQLYGVMTEFSWSWDLSRPVFLGVNGILTQNPVPTGQIASIGTPLSVNTVLIEIESIKIA